MEEFLTKVDTILMNCSGLSEESATKKVQQNCIACSKPLEAQKDSVRKHHFAYESNYEYMYAAEVATYKAAADVITELGVLCLLT